MSEKKLDVAEIRMCDKKNDRIRNESMKEIEGQRRTVGEYRGKRHKSGLCGGNWSETSTPDRSCKIYSGRRR